MRQLSVESLINILEYEKVRKEYRADIINYKKDRRVKVGPHITIVFENDRTLSFQIQEIMRAERIVQNEKIQEEVDIYNSIMPPKNGLSATLFIEVTEEQKIKSTLHQFIGLTTGKTISIKIDGQTIFAVFEEGREEEDKISSVHYIQFFLNKKQIEKMGEPNSKVEIGIDYNDYTHHIKLPNSTKHPLYLDMQ